MVIKSATFFLHYAGDTGGAKVIVLLFNAGPLDVTWAKLSPHVHAMLECFFPAQATGDALYQTLLAKSADAVPGGRLPATWPAYISQVRMMIHVCMQGSHGDWKTWKMKMVMEKSWNMTKWPKVMEFCYQSWHFTNFATKLYQICMFFLPPLRN